MVNVPIRDQNALGLVSVLRMARSDRHAIKQAEAHAARGAGVMAGRANYTKSVAHLLRENSVHSGERAACGKPGAGCAFGADGRIAGTELTAVLRDFALDKLDVFTRVG